MNKVLQGLSYKVDSTSLQKFKRNESSVLILGISAILPPAPCCYAMIISNIGLWDFSARQFAVLNLIEMPTRCSWKQKV